MILVTILAVLLPVFSARALTLSPPRILLATKAGSEAGSVIRLLNESSVPVRLVSVLQNFIAEGETGAPRFISADNQAFGLAEWLRLDHSNFVLAPNEERLVHFTISVPSDAAPGGHYGAILWSVQAEDADASGVNIVGQTGTLVLLTVTGALREEMQLAEFSRDEKLHDALPVSFSVRLENTGTVHVIPEGAVEIRNMFGKTVAELPLNAFRGTVLPDSVRRFNLRWEKQPGTDVQSPSLVREWSNFAFGRYTARLSVAYGSDQKFLQAEMDFWVLPWRVLALAAFGALVIVLGGGIGIRKYNRWIGRREIEKKS